MNRSEGKRPAPNQVDELLRQFLDDDLDQHLAYEQLEDLVDGRLTPDALESAQLHLSECATCREDMAHLREVAAQLTGRQRDDPAEPAAATSNPQPQTSPVSVFPSRSPAAPSRAKRVAWWVPALSAAAAIAIIAWAASRGADQPSGPIEQPPVAAVQPGPPTLLPLDKPDVRLGTGAIAWRGATSENPYVADLKPPLDAYRSGDYGQSDRLFAELAARYPSAVEIRFYQGISRLFLGDARGASAALAEAEKAGDRTFADDIAWYQAVADERAGDRIAAARRLERLCASPGARQTQSCDAVAAFKAGGRQ